MMIMYLLHALQVLVGIFATRSDRKATVVEIANRQEGYKKFL